MYKNYLKRLFDFALSLIAIVILSPVLLIVALFVRVKLGSPVIFKQKRPGKDEKIFTLYKFRTMTDEKDEQGNLLSDEIRLTNFGKLLRSTSLDELPELFNILKGDMTIVGPRPLLIRDMLFMSRKHRNRHLVRPGLTGLAQINGRNDIDWNDKLDLDIEYVTNITFFRDLKIMIFTVFKVLSKEGITEKDKAVAADYGDYLLNKNHVSRKEYDLKYEKEKRILENLNK